MAWKQGTKFGVERKVQECLCEAQVFCLIKSKGQRCTSEEHAQQFWKQELRNVT